MLNIVNKLKIPTVLLAVCHLYDPYIDVVTKVLGEESIPCPNFVAIKKGLQCPFHQELWP